MAVGGLPELDVARVPRWCAEQVPEHVRGEIRVECDVTPRYLTICECCEVRRGSLSRYLSGLACGISDYRSFCRRDPTTGVAAGERYRAGAGTNTGGGGRLPGTALRGASPTTPMR